MSDFDPFDDSDGLTTVKEAKPQLQNSIQRIQIINSREIRCSNSHLAALCH